MNFLTFMSSVPLREDILDDITYLQKHLRLIIKFHQKLSSKLYINTAARNSSEHSPLKSRNFSVIRSLMDDLEAEMDDISKEQRMLTDIVKNCMANFMQTLKKKSNIELDQDIANGYITRALSHHYEKNYFTIEPSNVKPRMSEEELRKKFNEVKGDGKADRAMMQLMSMKRDESEETSPKPVKRESLLKTNFRKPAANSNGHKKQPVVKSATNEVRRGGRVRKSVAKSVQPNTQTITHSRLNLLRALSKVKTEQVDNKEELDKFLTEKCRATLAQVGEDDGNVKFLRSDEEYSERSSSFDGTDVDVDPLKLPSGPGRKRKSPLGIHSEESSDGDYMKKYPNLPIEPPAKTEYNQVEFLSIFRLITPEFAESLKLRRSERKRRNCTKNHKNDFHYGNFDLNEAAYRVRLNSNKKSILYSPNNKQRLIK